ncbi:Mu transposase C-terminal domain-containing protein [Streptomyces sp. NPDC093675]|uniref:Mu transposase C-terminal domain-containing protein n=1 Tax=Streptomyces sp. NPDC093675 TaxID=3366049 RepID=UPI0038058C15
MTDGTARSRHASSGDGARHLALPPPHASTPAQPARTPAATPAPPKGPSGIERPGPVEDALGIKAADLRPAAVRRLAALKASGELTGAHLRLVAESLGNSTRTLRRWLKEAEEAGRLQGRPRPRFEVTDDIKTLLAYHRGNVSRAHEELAHQAADQDQPVVSLATLHRAVHRDLTPAARAALREGIPASRGLNPHFQRRVRRRNEVWEGDHVQAPVPVLVEHHGSSRLGRPWVTWFHDSATDMIMGYAVTPVSAHRGSILACLRSSLLRDDAYGPAGGIPRLVRIDGGSDFLSKTVTSAFGALAVPVQRVHRAHLKGGVERLNGTAATRFFADLPRYAHAQQLDHRRRAGDEDPPLTLASFVDLLHQWIHDHNTRRVPSRLGMTPLQAWQADPTPVRDVPREDLNRLMLETDGRPRRITSKGIELGGRHYIGPGITGRVGDTVQVLWMPHHEHEIEVFEHRSNRHLGTCHLADSATPEQIRAVQRSREQQELEARNHLLRAAKRRRTRYAPLTQPGQQPQQLAPALTTGEAAAELEQAPDPDRPRRSTRPPYQPHTPPAAHWVRPSDTTPDTTEKA